MLLAVLNTCLLLAAAAWLLSIIRGSSSTAVPVVPGLPLFGSVVALGRGGTAFLSQCRQQFGDVFCLRVLHQRMVFIFDPAMLSVFFKAPESQVSFKPAVKRFTQRVYGLPASEFFERHEPLLATLRQLLVPAQLEVLGRRLLRYAAPQLQDWQREGKVELWSACQRLVFQSAGRVLFGEAFFARHGLDAVQHEFLTFEENFEIAASPIPHLLLPAFRQSRSRLLSMFRESLAAGDFTGTVVDQLLQGCGMCARYQPNLLLAVLWASQANSMPALHWSMAFLLLPEQAAARQKVLTELSTAAEQQQQQQLDSNHLPAGQQPDGTQQQQQQQLIFRC
ncbi:cytochrome P450 [Scenedesmus sp. NREL 46B-D3]|nr:cytochrome P450 [Scenedesmus sp. NREL 46B-D3]